MTRIPPHRLSPATGATSARDTPDDWRNRAACLGEDPELFFAGEWEREPERSRRIEEAKAVCRRCDVMDTCLRWALDNRQDHGVWGGLTEDERRSMRRAQARTKPPATPAARKTAPMPPSKATPTERPACGTGPGYDTHTRKHERQCDDCRAWKAGTRSHQPPPCGTVTAYHRHRDLNEATCDACRAAKAAATARHRQRNRNAA